MAKDPFLRDTYEVLPDAIVKLTIKIGNAQQGVTTVLLGAKTLVKSQAGDLLDFAVGQGSEVAGKTLTCTTVVTAIMPGTTPMTVDYSLTGGPKNYSASLSTTGTQGDTAIFTAQFDILLA